ncbi:Transposase family Tnp2 protein [Ceratobasidium sp. AG-Ba]|nr:Transposase family Tnp2 protein [Ceratobasidium sp. AG-Ba]
MDGNPAGFVDIEIDLEDPADNSSNSGSEGDAPAEDSEPPHGNNPAHVMEDDGEDVPAEDFEPGPHEDDRLLSSGDEEPGTDLESLQGDIEMDLDNDGNQAAPPPLIPNILDVQRNPRVAIEDWDVEDWPDEELELGLDNDLGDPVDEMPDENLGELDLDDFDHEPANDDEPEPEFHELEHRPLGVDPDNEPEMDRNELWDVVREIHGALARQEWIDMYDRFINDADRKTLKFLAARLRSHMSRQTYDDIRLNVYEDPDLPSDVTAWTRLKVLSRLQSRSYDMCIESCICFLGQYSDYDHCPHCNNPRYNDNAQPRRTFSYTPLIPQLHGLFQNSATIKNMRHRAEHEAYRATHPGKMEDVFDGELYSRLRNTKVREDSEYRYFDSPNDIALGFGTDGFSMFKRRRRKGNSAAWPLILVNYNLHASIRYKLENIICVGVIPGPKECKDISSFLVPLIDELIELAAGVPSSRVRSEMDDHYDNGEDFVLRAFLIILFGDIPAISKILLLKGHNALSPCRTCLIHATPYVLDGGKTVYYVPLVAPGEEDDPFLPEHLMNRTHASFIEFYRLMEGARLVREREQIKKDAGLNGRTVFAHLGSIDLSSCAPYELMHLLFENLVPNMIHHWKGTFKWIEADGGYLISDADWERIGKLTAEATKTIPGQFVGTIPDIHKDMGLYKAEAFSFWFMYLAPILLQGVLGPPYYEHFLAMREIFIWCLDISITPEDIDALDLMIRDWVQEYERLYYRYQEDRLPTCPLTIHAILHITYYIRRIGPLSNTWCFVLERFCGYLLRPALMNRVRPYEYLDNFIRRRAQMQIVARVHDMPTLLRPNNGLRRVYDELISEKETIYPDFKDIVLGQPVKHEYQADNRLRWQMARYFGLSEGMQYTLAQHRERVDWKTLVRYGRFRLASMGDRVRVADLITRDGPCRDNSYIRYELLPDANASYEELPDQAIRVIHYGLVLDVFYLEYVRDQTADGRKPYLLARVRECETGGLDATRPENPLVEYNRLSSPGIINLNTVHAAVGRVHLSGNRWAIIDRSRGARIQFNNEDGEPDPELN